MGYFELPQRHGGMGGLGALGATPFDAAIDSRQRVVDRLDPASSPDDLARLLQEIKNLKDQREQFLRNQAAQEKPPTFYGQSFAGQEAPVAPPTRTYAEVMRGITAGDEAPSEVRIRRDEAAMARAGMTRDTSGGGGIADTIGGFFGGLFGAASKAAQGIASDPGVQGALAQRIQGQLGLRQRPEQQPAPKPGLPGWVLPVGIGVGLLVLAGGTAAVMRSRKRRSNSGRRRRRGA